MYVTLCEAKKHLLVDNSFKDDDEYILALIDIAEDAVSSLEKEYAAKKDEVPEGGWTPVTTGQYKGKVVITSLELNAPNGDNATFTASFEGVGALTKTA